MHAGYSAIHFYHLQHLMISLFYIKVHIITTNLHAFCFSYQANWYEYQFLCYSQCVLVVVQSPSHVRLFVTPWTAAHQASLSLTISQSLPKFTSISSVMPSSYLILWWPLLLLPSIFPSIRDFSNESSVPIRWPKYWSISFSIAPSREYSGLISLKIDWFDLLAVQGTFRSLL